MASEKLEEARKKCENWDEELGCLDDYPNECPVHEECKKDAESLED